eukprot:RCo049012
MCGIFAYVNFGTPRSRAAILQILLCALHRLEYRGCDSAGVGIDEDGDSPGRVRVIRKAGDVATLELEVAKALQEGTLRPEQVLSNHCAIAHTRWATHGAPVDRNAHPQSSSPANEFVVVHNGLLTNWAVLRKLLNSFGYEMSSETDTEVVPKLCMHLFQACQGRITFPQLVIRVVAQLEGAFGLVFKSSKYPNELVACRNGSPMILTIPSGAVPSASTQGGTSTLQSHEVFISSDACALLDHGSNVVYLEDGDVCHVAEGRVTLYAPSAEPRSPTVISGPPATTTSLERHKCRVSPQYRPPGMRPVYGELAQPSTSLVEITRQCHTLDVALETLMRGSFPHFMLKEIHEQPECLRNTMRGRILFPRAAVGLPPHRNSSRGNSPAPSPSLGACRERPEEPFKSPFDAGPVTVKLGGLVPHLEVIRSARRLLLLCVGSAYNSAYAVRNTLEELVDLPVQLELASDFLADRAPPVFREDCCCFLSYSGENAEVVAALRYCRDKGAFCVGFTNQVGSTVAQETHCGVYLHAGYESAATSTKVFGCSVVALLMLALVLSENNLRAQPRRE